MLRRQTEEEKLAGQLEKQQRLSEKEARKAAEAQAKQEKREREQAERERQAFLASPAGQARAAFDRGDHLFQFEIDVKDTKAVVIPMVTAMNTTSSTDPIEILNSVCREGWEIVNASFVFHELGSESRDKFMASGQNVAVKGTVIGYYVFRRCEENRQISRQPVSVTSQQ